MENFTCHWMIDWDKQNIAEKFLNDCFKNRQRDEGIGMKEKI